MKKILKKIGSVFLALCMVLTMLPAVTQPVFAAEEHMLIFDVSSGKFYVDVNDNYTYDSGTDSVYTEQSDKWSFSGNTLTLQGFEYTTTTSYGFLITGGELTINLADGTQNRFVAGHNNNSNNLYGIYTDRNLTIEGTGALMVEMADSPANTYCNYALRVKNLTINNGSVTAKSNRGSRSCGIYVQGDLSVKGGTVDAQAGSSSKSNGRSCGISCKGSVTISGGVVSASGSTGYKSIGISTSNSDGQCATISGGIVTAAGNTCAFGKNNFSCDANVNVDTTEYTYWTNDMASAPDGCTVYTQTADDGFDTPFANTTANKYVKINSMPIHDVTIAGTTNGSISASALTISAEETVKLTITPDSGYQLDTISVFKTGTPETTISLLGTNSFVMPDDDVTVSATFKELSKITIAGTTNGSISASALASSARETVTLTITPDSGYQLDTISAFKTGTPETTISLSGTDNARSFVMPDYDVTVSATFTAIPAPALSIDPVSYPFDSLEEGYSDGDATSKTFTITNKGNITLTGLKTTIFNDFSNPFSLNHSSFPSTLAPNESAQVTVTPFLGLSCGTYEATVKTTSDQGAKASSLVSLTVTEAVPRIILDSTIIQKLDSDFSGTGYSWNAQSNILTLASEYEAGPLEFLYCQDKTITLQLTGDVTIAEPITALGDVCIHAYALRNMIIDLGGHTLTLRTGNDDNSPLEGESITIQNGTLSARLLGSDTDEETPTISAGTLTVENATVIADADSSLYGGIDINTLILKQGANVQTSGYVGLDFSYGTFSIESDDISLTALATSIGAIMLDADFNYPTGSALRYWTNTEATPPSPAGDGTLLSSNTRDELKAAWWGSKYVKIGTETSNIVVTRISVKNNPDTLTYSEGDHLDLSGLAATLTYSNATIKDVPYTAFAANNISMTYEDGGMAAQGDTLSTAQDGKAIILTVGSYTAHTNTLTVKSIPKYNVTVTNGTGSGEYAEDASVTITADAAQEGKQFDGWTIDPSNVNFTEGSASTPTAKFSMPAKAVAAAAEYTDLVAGTYAINVLNDGHGMGSANVYAVAPDTEITLTAIPDSDYRFKEWQVISGSVTLENLQEAKTTFTMPAESVTVKAMFEALPTYTVTFDLNGGTRTGGGQLTQTVAQGDNAAAPAITRSGYTFTGWDKDFTNVTGDLTVTAVWHRNGGGSSGGGSSSGGSSDTPADTSPVTVSGGTARTTVTAKTTSDGKASASVTQSQMSGAIEKAQKSAQSTGAPPIVEIQVSGGSDASTVETSLPKAALQSLVTGEMESLILSGPVADMAFDAQAVAAIAGTASGDVSFTASNVENSTLSDAARQVVGDRPVYHFSVTSGSKTISQFNGTVTLSLPYTPAKGEDTNAIVAYYISADGQLELMQNCYYDGKAGALVFTTTHFSTYAVGYNKISFTDVNNSAWYADAVSFLAARDITGGTSKTTFSPNATLTRGQFITLLMRAYGIDADKNPTDNFSDAGNTYYTGYLAAAKQLGISNGVGNHNFAPEQAITRQQMFTLLYNALKDIDQLPQNDSAKSLSDFTDSGNIAPYAQEPMTYLVEAGAVSGNNGLLLPMATTTRAQMAQVLYNLLAK